MHKGFAVLTALLATLAFGTACTVHNTEAPSLSGVSEFGLSLVVTAIPDSINQDGASQSSIEVTVRDDKARLIQGQSLRVDMAVNGTIQDFGTLSARTIVTGSDGKARVVYTAPPAPPPSFGGAGGHVAIVVTPIGNNAQVSNPEFGPASIPTTVDIRLVPPGVILPPAQTPTPAFTFSPSPVNMNVPVTFDASTSCGGFASGGVCSGSSAITSYSWNFGDGSANASGVTVTHTFTSAATFNVTLTVTNDRGVAASTTQAITAAVSAAPTASFVFSPAAPTVNQTIVFNADASRAAPGRTLTQYSWIFGDGQSASGFLASHAFADGGGFNVTLTVLDDAGQKATASQTVTVTGGAAGGAPTANFTSSTSSPVVGQLVVFDTAGSAAAQGQTITSYAWNFGDGTPITTCPGDAACATTRTIGHTFNLTGTFTVNLVVTDSAGRTGSKSATVTVSSGNPTPSFTSVAAAGAGCPAQPPAATCTMVFDGSASTAVGGEAIATYTWNFGDLTAQVSGAAAIVNHTYAVAFRGTTVIVTLTVTDNASPSRSSSRSSAVTVP